MNCWYCKNEELVWQNDFSYEDYGLDGDGIVSVLHCENCNALVNVYLSLDKVAQ